VVESSISVALDRLAAVHASIRHAAAPFPQEPRDILAQGYGQCTHFAALLAEALISAGIPTRQFYLMFEVPGGTDDSHVCVEAYLEGAWRFLDPTYHRYWLGGGVRELLSDPDRLAEISQRAVTSGVEAYDPTDRYYEPATWRRTRLVRIINGQIGRQKPLLPYFTADYLRLAPSIAAACEAAPNRWTVLPSAGALRDLRAFHASFKDSEPDGWATAAANLARVAWVSAWLAFQRVRTRP